MTKLAKWHVEEILENFVLGGFPVKDDDRFLACSSILTSMIDTVEVDEPNKAFIFHTMSGNDYLCPFEDIIATSTTSPTINPATLIHGTALFIIILISSS